MNCESYTNLAIKLNFQEQSLQEFTFKNIIKTQSKRLLFFCARSKQKCGEFYEEKKSGQSSIDYRTPPLV